MATRRLELGATGEAVRGNITRSRKAGGLTMRALAERLAATDRPLSYTALSQIENGARRVDVDDLMALAYVLDVNPHALLLPLADTNNGEPETVTVTGVGQIGAGPLWEWADGELPLFTADEDPRAFTGRTRPPWRRTVDPDAETKDSLRGDLAALRLEFLTTMDTVKEVLQGVLQDSEDAKAAIGHGDDQ